MELLEILARRHIDVVTEIARDNRVVHYGLVGLVLEVAVPAGAELMAGPLVHLLKFFLSWADLDTGFNAVRRKRAPSCCVPFVKDLLLDFWVTCRSLA